MKSSVSVAVIALYNKSNQLLFMKIKNDHSVMAGKWVLPGGKIE